MQGTEVLSVVKEHNLLIAPHVEVPPLAKIYIQEWYDANTFAHYFMCV